MDWTLRFSICWRCFRTWFIAGLHFDIKELTSHITAPVSRTFYTITCFSFRFGQPSIQSLHNLGLAYHEALYWKILLVHSTTCELSLFWCILLDILLHVSLLPYSTTGTAYCWYSLLPVQPTTGTAYCWYSLLLVQPTTGTAYYWYSLLLLACSGKHVW